MAIENEPTLAELCADYRAKKAAIDEIQKDIDLRAENVAELEKDKKLNTELLAGFKQQIAEIMSSVKPNSPIQHTVLSPEEARQNIEKMDGLAKDMLSVEKVLLDNNYLLETAKAGLYLLKTNLGNHNHELVKVYQQISGFYWNSLANIFMDTIKADSENMKKIISLYNTEALRISNPDFSKGNLENHLGKLVIKALFNEHDIPRASSDELTVFISEFIAAN